MAIQTQIIERTFRYGAMTLEDPGIQYSPDQVKDFYANTYAELNNAAVEGPEEKDGKNVYTFRRAVGTKGGDVKAELVVAVNVHARRGIELIAAERFRQVAVKRWSRAHDDEHGDHSLALAACAYAAPQRLFIQTPLGNQSYAYLDCWPKSWSESYDKRPRAEDGGALLEADSMTTELRIRQLAKAGAMIAAEIDRLLRLKGKP